MKERNSESGIALLLTIIVSMVMALLGLSLTLSSSIEFSVSNEFENQKKAFMAADAGFNEMKNALIGQDFTTLLSANTNLPKFINYTDPAAGSFGYRTPLFPLEARNIDFSNPPTQVGTRSVNGLLTPPVGLPSGTGRFFAKLTDNADEAPLLLPDDPAVDLDSRVYLRVTGIHRGVVNELNPYGSSLKNSVVTIETLLKRDRSFGFGSPFTIYGPDAAPARNSFFDGNSFNVDGYDHAGWTDAQVGQNHNHNAGDPAEQGVSVVYDDLANGDAGQALDSIYNDMSGQQHDNIEGEAGAYGPEPSMADNTQTIRDAVADGSNPDAGNIFNADFMATMGTSMAPIADNLYTGATVLGDGDSLGTPNNPQVTVVNGDLEISGGGQGAGLLVVTGRLDYNGAFDFHGTIMVIGEGIADFGGANKDIRGGLFVARIEDDGNGNNVFGIPQFTLGGNSNFYYDSSWINRALGRLPIVTLSWREITPEIEPL